MFPTRILARPTDLLKCNLNMLGINKHGLILCAILFCCMALFVSCEKDDDDDEIEEIETGTLTDVDGNTYRTVKIGAQWWMAENLKVTHYRNGEPIPEALTNSQWSNANDAYCLYDNNTSAPGLLYNYQALISPKTIAPEGWHIPSDEEWKQLEIAIGMSGTQADLLGWRGSDEAEKLKLKGTEGWVIFQDLWPTNKYGFSAEAGSCRLFNGKLGSPGLQYTGFWWTSTSHSSDKAWFRYLDYKKTEVFRSYDYKQSGFSIRCVKD